MEAEFILGLFKNLAPGVLVAAAAWYAWRSGHPRKNVPRDHPSPRPLPPDFTASGTGESERIREESDDKAIGIVSGRPVTDDPVSDLESRLRR